MDMLLKRLVKLGDKSNGIEILDGIQSGEYIIKRFLNSNGQKFLCWKDEKLDETYRCRFKNKVTTYLIFTLLFVGYMSYVKSEKSEDPGFTVKVWLSLTTNWPGATSRWLIYGKQKD